MYHTRDNFLTHSYNLALLYKNNHFSSESGNDQKLAFKLHLHAVSSFRPADTPIVTPIKILSAYSF